MTHRSLIFDAPSERGGTYALERVWDEADTGERHVLTLHEIDGQRAARIAAATAGGVAALTLGGLAVGLLPVHGAPDGLTPTRGDYWPHALAIGGALGALAGVLVGRVVGAPSCRALVRRGVIALPKRLEAVFDDRVVVDGADTGRLRSIESHPASSIVLVVTERATVRLMLAETRDALALAAMLESVRGGRRATPRMRPDQ